MNPALLSVITRPDQAAALMQPERLRLLEALGEPDSAAGLARRFALPRQRLNYHLKELERVGLLEFVEERRKGNCVERMVRATARAYAISPEILGALGHTRERAADRLSATYLVAVASRAIKEIAGLLTRAAAAGKRVATLTLDTEIRFADAAVARRVRRRADRRDREADGEVSRRGLRVRPDVPARDRHVPTSGRRCRRRLTFAGGGHMTANTKNDAACRWPIR